jgi:predicted ATP-grasp superfamily ATP-dependent carboligase
MKLYLYEYACAQPDDVEIPESVRREGRAMFDAVLEDARKLSTGIEIITPDSGLSAHDSLEIDKEASCCRAIRGSAGASPSHLSPLVPFRISVRPDAALIIAPEFDGILERLVRQASDAGWELLGPSPEAIHLTSDKWQLYQHWKQHQVPTPLTWLASEPPTRSGRYLVKHRWGAGSLGVKPWQPGMQCDEQSIIQEHHTGIPVSVAFLVDLNGKATPLWPAYQHISDDGHFQYLGGSLVQNVEHRERIIRLATSAIQSIGGLLGYIGVDALLCDMGDVVLEINPRLTTSYLGLRQATTSNLVGCMLACAKGDDFKIDWVNKQISWVA